MLHKTRETKAIITDQEVANSRVAGISPLSRSSLLGNSCSVREKRRISDKNIRSHSNTVNECTSKVLSYIAMDAESIWCRWKE